MSEEANLEELLRTGEAAAILGVSSSRVRQFCAQGRLGTRLWGGWAIGRIELRRFARKKRPVGYPKGRPRKVVP